MNFMRRRSFIKIVTVGCFSTSAVSSLAVEGNKNYDLKNLSYIDYHYCPLKIANSSLK